MQITLQDYLMGRDQAHPGELTEFIARDATATVMRVNDLLAKAVKAGVTIDINPKTGTPVSSGWRPYAVNAATPGAAVRSKHMTGQACDLYDPDGDLDDFCLSNPELLQALGLWLEHPSATKGWCHVQTIAPRSGKRVFYP